MDCANWYWGESSINILMPSVAYKGIALSILWCLLPKSKCGNSDTTERVALIRQFIERFGKASIAGILADREFIGDDWIDWLLQESIPYFFNEGVFLQTLPENVWLKTITHSKNLTLLTSLSHLIKLHHFLIAHLFKKIQTFYS